MGYTLPLACMPSGNIVAMTSPTSRPNAAPVSHTQTEGDIWRGSFSPSPWRREKTKSIPLTNKKHWHEGAAGNRHGGGHSGHPELRQRDERHDESAKKTKTHFTDTCRSSTYLHDDEEDERDEDVDLWVFPGMVVADVVKLLRHALAAPRAVVKQRDERLVLRQLAGGHERKVIWTSVFYSTIPRPPSRRPRSSAAQAVLRRRQLEILGNAAFDAPGWRVLHVLLHSLLYNISQDSPRDSIVILSGVTRWNTVFWNGFLCLVICAPPRDSILTGHFEFYRPK